MKLTKFIKVITAFLLISLGTWYFFIKDYNYKITFKTNQAPGVVYDHILKWNNGESAYKNVITLLKKSPFNQVEQNLLSGDSIYRYNWNIKRENDSTTEVTVKIKDENHSLKQNFQVIFFKNAFVKKSIRTVETFGKELIQVAKTFKLSEVTKSQIPAQNCLYISLNSKVNNKARTMLDNISVLTDYIKDNKIDIDGSPFLDIKEWNVDEDSIVFDFCFPIKEITNRPLDERVKLKKTKPKKALMMIYNGNYRASNMAWYALIDYAKINNIRIEYLPVEFFLNDPHQGGDVLMWQANIYMPIMEVQ